MNIFSFLRLFFLYLLIIFACCLNQVKDMLQVRGYHQFQIILKINKTNYFCKYSMSYCILIQPIQNIKAFLKKQMISIPKETNLLTEQAIRMIIANPKCDETCEIVHGGHCNAKAITNLIMGVKGAYKMYLVAHVVPLLLFKLSKLKKNPRKELWKLLIGLANSLLFAAFTNAISHRFVCIFNKYFSNKFTVWPAVISGISLLFQSPTRQTEISLYCVGKAWEAAYCVLKRRNYPVVLRRGNMWISGISLAIICYVFFEDSLVFREGYRSLLGKLLHDI